MPNGAWWRDRLWPQFTERPRKDAPLVDSERYERTRDQWLNILWAHYSGEAPLSNVSEQWKPSTREFQRLSKTNYAAVVVDALLDRIQFQGVRRVAVDGSDDTDGDADVREFLAENGAVVEDAQLSALALGMGHIMVGPAVDGGMALATPVDPRRIIIEFDPRSPRRALAACRWFDMPDGERRLEIFIAADEDGPDRVETFAQTRGREWRRVGADSGALPVQGLGVPVATIPNRRGIGEFEPHINLLNRISEGIADRLWAAKFQVFIQRAIIGDIDETDEDGNPIDLDTMLRADPGAMWTLPADTKVWEGRQIDLNAFLLPSRDDVKELASATSTPLHMFTPDAISGSAEGASLAREGISAKAEDRIRRWSPEMVRLARLGLAYSGRDHEGPMVPIWAPVERLSMAARADAASKMEGKLPREVIWQKIMQFTPAEVDMMRREFLRERLLAGALSDGDTRD